MVGPKSEGVVVFLRCVCGADWSDFGVWLGVWVGDWVGL